MKAVTCMALLCLPLFGHAQFNKGQMFIGGSIGTTLTSTSSDPGNPTPSTSSTSNFSFRPKFGYFINDKWAIGLGLTATRIVTKSNNTYYNGSMYVQGYQQNKNLSGGATAFARYFIPVTENFYIALQGQLDFVRSSNETYFTDTSGNFTSTKVPLYSVDAIISPVFIFFPTKKLGIEGSFGSMGYTYTHNLPNLQHGSLFNLSAGNISLGGSYYFARK